MKKKRIVIIGSRGIPASYGGFETSIEETSVKLVQYGYEVEVHCRSHHYEDQPVVYRGIRLRYLPSIKHKSFDTITHTLLSTLLMFFIPVDFIFLYGVGNSIWLPILRLRGVPIIAVVDGADWERAKWNILAKAYLRANRKFAVVFADHYVVDNEVLAADYEKRFGIPAVYIPYGTSAPSPVNPSVLKRFGLEEKNYVLFVGRFVKEKGVDLLIRAFEKCSSSCKLVIVGGNDLDKKYVESLQETKDPRIIFTGLLYGPEYESLLQKALFYVSASLLEGTSPSLLNAMALNGFALVSDLPENLEVLKGSCATFETGNVRQLTEKLDYFITSKETIEKERSKTKYIVERYYTWDGITQKYLKLLL